MTMVANTLLSFLTEAWAALAGAVLVLGLIGLLIQVLRAAGSAAVGSHFGLADAAGAMAGLIFILLFALLGVPALAAGVEVAAAPCGPIADLGAAAAGIIAALASVRMLVACLHAATTSSLGFEAGYAVILIEVGEAILGMLLTVLAGPLAAHFLGVC